MQNFNQNLKYGTVGNKLVQKGPLQNQFSLNGEGLGINANSYVMPTTDTKYVLNRWAEGTVQARFSSAPNILYELIPTTSSEIDEGHFLGEDTRNRGLWHITRSQIQARSPSSGMRSGVQTFRNDTANIATCAGLLQCTIAPVWKSAAAKRRPPGSKKSIVHTSTHVISYSSYKQSSVLDIGASLGSVLQSTSMNELVSILSMGVGASASGEALGIPTITEADATVPASIELVRMFKLQSLMLQSVKSWNQFICDVRHTTDHETESVILRRMMITMEQYGSTTWHFYDKKENFNFIDIVCAQEYDDFLTWLKLRNTVVSLPVTVDEHPDFVYSSSIFNFYTFCSSWVYMMLQSWDEHVIAIFLHENIYKHIKPGSDADTVAQYIISAGCNLMQSKFTVDMVKCTGLVANTARVISNRENYIFRNTLESEERWDVLTGSYMEDSEDATRAHKEFEDKYGDAKGYYNSVYKELNLKAKSPLTKLLTLYHSYVATRDPTPSIDKKQRLKCIECIDNIKTPLIGVVSTLSDFYTFVVGRVYGSNLNHILELETHVNLAEKRENIRLKYDEMIDMYGLQFNNTTGLHYDRSSFEVKQAVLNLVIRDITNILPILEEIDTEMERQTDPTAYLRLQNEREKTMGDSTEEPRGTSVRTIKDILRAANMRSKIPTDRRFPQSIKEMIQSRHIQHPYYFNEMSAMNFKELYDKLENKPIHPDSFYANCYTISLSVKNNLGVYKEIQGQIAFDAKNIDWFEVHQCLYLKSNVGLIDYDTVPLTAAWDKLVISTEQLLDETNQIVDFFKCEVQRIKTITGDDKELHPTIPIGNLIDTYIQTTDTPTCEFTATTFMHLKSHIDIFLGGQACTDNTPRTQMKRAADSAPDIYDETGYVCAAVPSKRVAK
jgi:hypothetical protein